MLNSYFAGAWMPRIQPDLVPALRCAAHFVIVADEVPETIDDYLNGGRALQRFWLTAAKLGLQFQPEMTPLIFSRSLTQTFCFLLRVATVNLRLCKLSSREGASCRMLASFSNTRSAHSAFW